LVIGSSQEAGGVVTRIGYVRPVTAPRLASLRLDDQVELAYAEWGAGERVVLCIHGLTRNALDFDVLAAALARTGRRVIAIDMVGRGGSSWLADPHGYNVLNYVGHIGRFCAQLGIAPTDWVGTSMGGLIGMVAAQSPTVIRRLVLNDVGPFVAKEALAMIAFYVGITPKLESFEAVERYLRQIHSGFGPLTDEQWRHLATHSARRDGAQWKLHYDPKISIAHAEGAKADIDLWPLWDSIKVPTLLLRGETSRILDAATAQRMTETGPRAKLVTFAGVGHAPALMAEDQIEAIERFLA
jgi:pimeloyl-ACP methyl ester carboxylesterase